MSNNPNKTNFSFFPKQAQLFYFPLHYKDIAEELLKLNIPKSVLEERFHILLKYIKRAFEQGELLTYHTVDEWNKVITDKQVRIPVEGAFQDAWLSEQQKGDWLGIKEQLQSHIMHKEIQATIRTLNEDKDLKDKSFVEMKEAYRALIDKANSVMEQYSPNEMSDTDPTILQLFQDNLTFPLEIFPQKLQALIQQLSSSFSAPVDYVACIMLSLFGGCLGQAYEWKINDTWKEATNLWLAIVGDISENKSPVLNYLSKPIDDIELEYFQEWKKEMEHYESNVMTYAKEKKQWERDKTTAPFHRSKPERPELKQLTLCDTTLEAIGPIFLNNRKGLLIKCDELGTFLNFDKYHKGGGDRENYCSSWNRATAKINRKGQDTIYLPNFCLSIVGNIPPQRFRDYMAGTNMDMGLTARFLVCYPKPLRDVFKKVAISEELLENYNNLLSKCIEANLTKCESENGHTYYKSEVVFATDEAIKKFTAYYNQIMALKMEYSFPKDVFGLLGKMKGYMARLALIIQIIKYFDGKSEKLVIDEDSIEKAKKLVYYFLSHCNKVFTEARKKTPNNDLAAISHKLNEFSKKHKNEKQFKISVLAGQRWTKDTAALKNTLQKLAEHGHIRFTPDRKEIILL